MAERAAERFPLAGKWVRRLMILSLFLCAAWMWLLGPWFVALPILVFGPAQAVAEVYAAVRRHSEYIQLLPDGILMVGFGGVPLVSGRIAYELIGSVGLRDGWFERANRAMLRMARGTYPPGVELRLRRRVFFWWLLWPQKKIYIRPTDPEAVVVALSARLGVT